MRKTLENKQGITLVALVVTIIILLILAGVTIVSLFGENGIITKAQHAADSTNDATAEELQGMNDLLDKMNSILSENGMDSVETDDGKFAMFDTGTNVANKIRTLVADGNIVVGSSMANLSIDGIKKYTGTPDISSMTDANIVSSTELYELYQQNPELFEDILPVGAELCPIYIWFEESGDSETRNIIGTSDDLPADGMSKEVTPGTLYWWCETSNVYLNMDSSYMFAGLPYLSDISGLQNVKTNYTINLRYMFCPGFNNIRLTNINALSNWDTSAVTDMSGLFSNCAALEDLSGLQNWNTSSVEDMSNMFNMYDAGGSSITNLSSLSKWNVSNVTNMNSMFYMCMNLSDASGINNWNIVNVTGFYSMFGLCSTHPNFTKVTGTWDELGTFTPD